ncbi:MAG: primosomal protein N' [Myxococcota bacterium]
MARPRRPIARRCWCARSRPMRPPRRRASDPRCRRRCSGSRRTARPPPTPSAAPPASASRRCAGSPTRASSCSTASAASGTRCTASTWPTCAPSARRWASRSIPPRRRSPRPSRRRSAAIAASSSGASPAAARPRSTWRSSRPSSCAARASSSWCPRSRSRPSSSLASARASASASPSSTRASIPTRATSSGCASAPASCRSSWARARRSSRRFATSAPSSSTRSTSRRSSRSRRRATARDLALVRGSLAGVPVVLGSATPSVESWANVQRHKLTRLDLTDRAGEPRPLPTVDVVDLREEPFADKDRIISQRLFAALKDTLAAEEQAILFLNRRGFASFIQCVACGKAVACESCSVSYTWHRGRGRMVCHYCDRTRAFPVTCPSCGSRDLTELGFGTEQVEAALALLVPGARIARMDRDTTRGKALFRLLTRYRKREIDVLIGTQMVAKGHDFPGVTLVGVLAADQGLSFPDPRSAERTVQLLTQIAGRAGRGERPGRVLVQTYAPEHYAIQHALAHDAVGFLDTELALRKARGFPPWTHLALFRVSGPDAMAASSAADALGRSLREAAERLPRGSVVVHPAQPAPIERIKDRYRFQVLLSAPGDRKDLRAVLEATKHVWGESTRPGHVQLALDVDPFQFL